MYDVVVVGGGVVGALVLRELSKYKLRIALLEKGTDLASGATRANSAIVHAGYDPVPGTLKAELNVEGSLQYPSLCALLGVKYIPLPSVVAAFGEDEMDTLNGLYERGRENGVPALDFISEARLRELEPNIAITAKGGLFAPSSAIIEPWAVAIAAAENACENGAAVFRRHEVAAIEKISDGFLITARTGEGEKVFKTRCIVNAAGVFAASVHNMVAPAAFEITGKKGQYLILDKSARGLVNNILFPCPSEKGKGMLILPEFHGRIMLGPDSELSGPEDTSTDPKGIGRIREAVSSYLDVEIPYGLTIRSFSGVRPVPSGGDFIIEESEHAKGFIDAAGIESPGLASAPAIARRVEGLVLDALGGARENGGYCERRAVQKPEGSARIVCKCEKITEAEVVSAIRRPCGAQTVVGVKLRAGVGAGRCQGGFCTPAVVDILARELGIDKSEVLYDRPGSHILTGRTRERDES